MGKSVKAKKTSSKRGKPQSAPKTHRRASDQKSRPSAAARNGHWVSEAEISHLRDTLREAQETLDAIRSGEVDAVVVSGSNGNQIYSLTSAEEPYRIYVERMQEGAVTVSTDALVLYCNQKFADMMQLPLERVIGSQLLEHLEKEAWNKISGIFASKEEVVKHECALRRGDGSEFPVNLTGNRLPLQEQTVMCLVVTDLTDQKHHERMRLAKEVAEKASAAKDDFLAALSHELRTPLTPVLMTAAALEQDETVPASARESLSMIRRNVELEARLIDDLLDLTRIEKGKLELHEAEFNFHTIIDRAIEICRPEFVAKSQNLALNLEAKNHLVCGDSVRIQQALWNLIRNAVKFTKENGSITIRTANPTPDSLLFEVNDTGIGFEPGSAEHLFQPFEQGGRNITRQFGGLGLGLAITRSIITAHGGKIFAESKGLWQGASFSFQLPMRTPRRTTSPTATPPNVKKGSSRKQILLVEDHKDTRTSLEFLLKKARHDVISAGSAKEALELAAQNEFDLVISDIGLPDKSGLELMRQLKNEFNLKGIGLSGFGMDEDIAKGRSAGFVQYLTKPVHFAELKQIISEI